MVLLFLCRGVICGRETGESRGHSGDGVAIAGVRVLVESPAQLLQKRKEAILGWANLHDDADGVTVGAEGGVGGLGVGRHFESWF